VARQVQGPGRRSQRVRLRGEASSSRLGTDQEAKVRAGTWNDPAAGEITVSEWIERWKATQDVGLSTTENREYLIGRFSVEDLAAGLGGRMLLAVMVQDRGEHA
jgi:hypothetical protein